MWLINFFQKNKYKLNNLPKRIPLDRFLRDIWYVRFQKVEILNFQNYKKNKGLILNENQELKLKNFNLKLDKYQQKEG